MYGKTWAEAHEKLTRLKADSQAGLPLSTSTMTLHEHPTCASLLHEQGADARMIMEVLGHSSIRVTMDVYTFVGLDARRWAFGRVGDALNDSSDEGEDGDPGAAPAVV